MNTEALKEVLEGSEAGKVIFLDVVKKLLALGVQWYFADLVRGEETLVREKLLQDCEALRKPESVIRRGVVAVPCK